MRRTILVTTIAATLAAGIAAPATAATGPSNTTTTTTTTTTTVTTTTVTTTTTTTSTSTAGRPVPRRASVVSGYASVAGYSRTPGYGMVNIMIQTRHRVPAGYAPSAYSPVQVQRMVGRTWRTVLVVTTGRDGLAFKTIIAPSGRQVYRYVRPQGATVTAATSRTMIVYVPATPGC
jgi:hypothetical protein